MRIKQIGIASLAATLMAAAPAYANGMSGPANKIDHFAPGDEIVPIVAPGEEIGIACDALEVAAPNNDVRVVLTISAAPTDGPSPGYQKVLATNEELTKGAVHVRIPEVPDLANHTVNVNVYVVNADGARNCDAGHMHIAERSQHAKGKQS